VLAVVILISCLAVLTPNSYASPSRVGAGKLYAFDPTTGKEAPKDASGDYQLLPAKKYKFNITGITEYEQKDFYIWARYSIDNTRYVDDVYGPVHAGAIPVNVTFTWTIPDKPVGTEIRICYGTQKIVLGDVNEDGVVNINDLGCISGHWTGAPGALPYDPNYDPNLDGVININDMGIVSGNWGKFGWCYAMRAAVYEPRILLVVPEVPLGAISAAVALFTGLGIKKFAKRKEH
jgi:hypothetical protein